MSLRISGKQMEIGEAFRSRIEGRIGEAVDKYFDGGFSGKVTVEKTASRFSADCMIHLDTGMALQATGEGQEPTGAFDVAADRIEKRLRRYKRRLKSHAPAVAADDETIDLAYRVVTPVAEGDEEVAEDYAPTVVAESTLALRRMSVADAVIELDTKDSPVFLFRNASNDRLSIVYRRPDGNIGWIDTASASHQ